MKKKEFLNMIVECVREVLNENKCNCKDTCGCKTNETKVSACNDCGKPNCPICNPKGEKNPKKPGYINPSQLTRMLNNARKERENLRNKNPRNKNPRKVIDRVEKIIRMIQAKSNSGHKSKTVNESDSSLSDKITAALEKYRGADEKTVHAYVKSHIKDGVTLRDLELDARAQKWNSDTTQAIYKILGNIKK